MEYFGYNIDNIKTVQDIERDLQKKYKAEVWKLHPDRNRDAMKTNDTLVYKNWGDMCEHYAYLKGLCERSPKNQKTLLYNLKLYSKTLKKNPKPNKYNIDNIDNGDDALTESLTLPMITESELEYHLQNQN